MDSSPDMDPRGRDFSEPEEPGRLCLDHGDSCVQEGARFHGLAET